MVESRYRVTSKPCVNLVTRHILLATQWVSLTTRHVARIPPWFSHVQCHDFDWHEHRLIEKLQRTLFYIHRFKDVEFELEAASDRRLGSFRPKNSFALSILTCTDFKKGQIKCEFVALSYFRAFLFCRHFFFIYFLYQIASNNLWHPRRSVLEYLQVMIFANLFAITSNPQFVLDVKDLVLRLLADEQLEVSVSLNSK